MFSPPKALSRPSLKDIRRLLAGGEVVDECWIWQGYCDPKGYGQIKINGVAMWVHRVSYAAFNGELPGDVTVHHNCYNSSYFNPDHLELLSLSENTADRFRRES